MTTTIIEGTSTEVLTKAELKTLAQYEAVIEGGMRSFVAVGNALAAIRDSRLYRATHGTFEAYVADKWHWDRSHAYAYIAGAEVQQNVGSISQLPGIGHASLLRSFDPEKQRELAPLIANLTQTQARELVRAEQGLRPRNAPYTPPGYAPGEVAPPTTQLDPAFASLRDATRLALGWVPDGEGGGEYTDNALARMHVDDLAEVADFIKRLAAAYNEARNGRTT